MFDELNIVQTKKHIHKLYQAIYKIVKQEFLKVLNEIYQTIYDEAVAMGFDGNVTDLDEGWIESFFADYNPVTKYVFSNEIGRKESRLFEALAASAREQIQSYKTAENLIVRQIEQCAVDLEDSVARVVYKDVGVQKVRWVAEHDHRTCDVCSGLDGQVFELSNAPDKQHINCRCYLVPVTG